MSSSSSSSSSGSSSSSSSSTTPEPGVETLGYRAQTTPYIKQYSASAAIPKYARVTLNSFRRIAKSGLAEKDIGTAMEAAAGSGSVINVLLRTAPGVHKMIASEEIAIGVTVYTESDGEVQDTAQATAYIVGTAMTSADADQDVIDVLYNAHGDTAAS